MRERVDVPGPFLIDYKKYHLVYKVLGLANLYCKGYQLYRDVAAGNNKFIGNIYKKKFTAAKCEEELIKIVADEKHLHIRVRFMADILLMEVWNLPGFCVHQPKDLREYFNNMIIKYGAEHYLKGMKYLKGWCGAAIDHTKAYRHFIADRTLNRYYGLAQLAIAQMDNDHHNTIDEFLEPIKRHVEFNQDLILNYFEQLRLMHTKTEYQETLFLLQELNHIILDVPEVKATAKLLTKTNDDPYVANFNDFNHKRKYAFWFYHGKPEVQRTLFSACAAALHGGPEECMNHIKEIASSSTAKQKHRDLAVLLLDIIQNAELPVKNPLHYMEDVIKKPEYEKVKTSWEEAMKKSDFRHFYNEHEAKSIQLK